MGEYKMGGNKYKIHGKLRKAEREDLIHEVYKNLYVNIYRCGVRRKYIDESGQVFVKCNGCWWKFPEEVEF